MIKFNNTYCIIPLRKGSKSIKDKNIKKINGTPLANLCIKTSLKSGIFKKIIIATDSDAYIKIIKNKFYNNKKLIYFKRSKKNAKSHSPTELVINEILKNFKQIDNIFLITIILKYKKRGLVKTVNGIGAIPEITEKIIKALK